VTPYKAPDKTEKNQGQHSVAKPEVKLHEAKLAGGNQTFDT
jgi:hypothetical protein